MKKRRKNATHDLRAGVEARVTVALAVDDERVAVGIRNRDTAFDTLRLPHRGAPPRLLKIDQNVAGRARQLDSAGPDRRVTPERRRPFREKQRDRDRHQHRSADCESCSARPGENRQDERSQNDDNSAPRPWRGQKRQRAKTPDNRTGDCADGVPQIRRADVPANILAAFAE